MPEKGLFENVKQDLAFKAVRRQLVEYLASLIANKRILKVGMGVEVVFKTPPLYLCIRNNDTDIAVNIEDMSVVFARVDRKCPPNGLCYIVKKIN